MTRFPVYTLAFFTLLVTLAACEKDYEELTVLVDTHDPAVVTVGEPVDTSYVWDGTPGEISALPAKGSINNFPGLAFLRRSNANPRERAYFLINRLGDCDGFDESEGGEIFWIIIGSEPLRMSRIIYENSVDPDNIFGAYSDPVASANCIDSTSVEIYEATDTRIRGRYVGFFEVPQDTVPIGNCIPDVAYDVITLDFDVPVVCVYE